MTLEQLPAKETSALDGAADGSAGAPTTPLLSVVVVTYNVRPLLERCLNSVFASETPFGVEVCVVDTGTDGSAAMVRRAFPQATVLHAPHNPGFAAANNLGLRRTRGLYCLLLNPDTEVPPDALAATVAALEEDRSVGILGPKLVRADGRARSRLPSLPSRPRNALFHFLRLPRLFLIPLFGEYNLTYRDPDVPYDVDAVTGAYMLLRRDVLEKIGLLDETFWMYGEDYRPVLAQSDCGWRTRYHPAVQVLHLKADGNAPLLTLHLRVFPGDAPLLPEALRRAIVRDQRTAWSPPGSSSSASSPWRWIVSAHPPVGAS